jgi:hypothetical protein
MVRCNVVLFRAYQSHLTFFTGSSGNDQKRKEISDQIRLLQVEKAKICFQTD